MLLVEIDYALSILAEDRRQVEGRLEDFSDHDRRRDPEGYENLSSNLATNTSADESFRMLRQLVQELLTPMVKMRNDTERE